MTFQTLPNDPLFNQQWYLLNIGQTGGIIDMDLNVVPVWADYTGVGIHIAVLDDGVEYTHTDLVGNYNDLFDLDAVSRTEDGAPVTVDDNHGTAVAGIIAASGNNGEGGVGVAPDASLSSVRLGFDGDPNFYENASFALDSMVFFDIANNSWGYSEPFVATSQDYPLYTAALNRAVTEGRSGLGTIVVFSGGNNRESGGSSNYNNLENSRQVIAVAALTHTGIHTAYSSPGANLLVSAFGGEGNRGEADGIVTTDREGNAGYVDTGDYTDSTGEGSFGGTSSAAPMVSGIVALMLEAAPYLGYRDVQEILAYSARQTDLLNPTWQTNGATNWNGGGLRTSTDYGFGLVDARAAVRLAETWQGQQTAANEQFVEGANPASALITNEFEFESQITLESSLTIEFVEVDVNIEHEQLGDVELVLISPSGTESVLMARPGVFENDSTGIDRETLQFTFSSTQFWGEDAAGDWTLVMRDRISGDDGILNGWSLRAYGNLPTDDNTYIYTNAFSDLANPNRESLQDLTGFDTLNAAAVTADLTLNLNPGSASLINNRFLIIAPDTIIESAFGGDGNDTITGNAVDNRLSGMRGEDTLQGLGGDDWILGNQGNDWLDGGAGNDSLIGGNGRDSFYFSGEPGIDVIGGFTPEIDQIVLDGSAFAPIAGEASVTFGLVLTDEEASLSGAAVVYNQTTGHLFYNPNGSVETFGNGGHFATLPGSPTLAATDFVVV